MDEFEDASDEEAGDGAPMAELLTKAFTQGAVGALDPAPTASPFRPHAPPLPVACAARCDGGYTPSTRMIWASAV